MYRYPAEFERDDNDTYIVRFPDIPEAITFGEDVEDALRHAGEALEAALSTYMDRRLDIPSPSRPRGKKTFLVSLPALSDAKVGLYMALRSAGWKKADLARRLGWQRSQVDRLLDLNHHSRLDHLEEAFAALGKRISIKVLDAA